MQPETPAEFNAWARAKAGVPASVDEAEVTGGSADGGAGHSAEMPLKPPPDPNKVLRAEIGMLRMRRAL
jgi:hypothetical protein